MGSSPREGMDNYDGMKIRSNSETGWKRLTQLTDFGGEEGGQEVIQVDENKGNYKVGSVLTN
ncbi:MAG TPA: hypothetical protein VH088_14050 [Terriglobales bacterium]|jgi:hypothetical protein|nr:hypothetical protein [Terriglobales bacterium]